MGPTLLQAVPLRHAVLWRAAVKRKAKIDELDLLAHEGRSDLEVIEDQIADKQTRYLLKEAQRYLIPSPEMTVFPVDEVEGQWKRSPTTGGYHLTPEAAHALRELVAKAETTE